jgi:hypothetical protein
MYLIVYLGTIGQDQLRRFLLAYRGAGPTTMNDDDLWIKPDDHRYPALLIERESPGGLFLDLLWLLLRKLHQGQQLRLDLLRHVHRTRGRRRRQCTLHTTSELDSGENV